jgi:hypothetical protein
VIVDIAKAIRIEDEEARRGGLGLKRFGAELVGPCAQCGGTDRFAASIKKQLFLCRACGRGSRQRSVETISAGRRGSRSPLGETWQR